MATKLGLMQGACRKLRQIPIATLTDDNMIRYQLDLVYDETLLSCLAEGDWNFAIRDVAMEHSTDIEPVFGFTFAFEKPDDWIRTSAISSDSKTRLALEEFDDKTTNWQADCDPIYVSYVSSDVNFGLNLANWSKLFEDFVEFDLALEISGIITGMSVQEKNDLMKDRQQSLRNARAKDARNESSKCLPPGRLVTSRLGSRSRYFGLLQNG